MSKNERIDCLNTFMDDELRIRKSKLFHRIVADGKKDFFNLSVLDLNKVKIFTISQRCARPLLHRLR